MAIAQESSGTPPPDQLVDSERRIDTVVVTARRTEESSQEVPVSMTIVTDERLKDLNVRDISDVQRVTPGLFVYGTGQGAGKAKLSIRGQTEVDDRLTGDRSVGVYIDGVHFAHDYGLTTALVDIARVEVLKGPQGTLFGKNTTGGAINITTQQPEYEWGGYTEFKYGSYSYASGLGVLNAPIVDQKLALRVVGKVTSSDGYYTDFNGNELLRDNSLYGRLLLRGDPTENLNFLISADYIRSRNGGIHNGLTSESLQTTGTGGLAIRAIALQLGLDSSSAADLATAYNAYLGFFNASMSDYGRNFSSTPGPLNELDNWSVAGTVTYDLGDVTLKSITSYRNLEKDVFFDLDNTPFDLVFQRQPAENEVFSQEFQASAFDGEGLDWQVGAYYDRDSGIDKYTNNILDYINPNRPTVTESKILSESTAVYGQGIYNFSDTFRVTAGLRYTEDKREIESRNRRESSEALPPDNAAPSRCNLLDPSLGGPVYPNCSYTASVTDDSLTWLLSADWKPVSDVMLYTTVSTGYRSGAFNAPGFSGPIPTVAENDAAFTPYDPEKLTNYEVGLKSDLLDQKLRLNAALFYQDYKDVQVRARIPVSGAGAPLQTISNAADATLYGGEFELTALLAEHLAVNATASYVNAEYDEYIDQTSSGGTVDRTSQPFPIPEWQYSLGADYEVPLDDGRVKFNLTYSYTDDTIFVPNAIIDNPTVVDAVTQKAYGLFGGRISWEIDSQDMEVAVFGKNLADEEYAANLFDVGFYTGVIPGAPRTLGIELRKSF
tara:strand:- start:35148 stop:37478 length:2331 start_codon:yes stop_codon:yes gene_type:complete